ncbi:MAG: FixH family protein [Alphaproteobacteria bacterium]
MHPFRMAWAAAFAIAIAYIASPAWAGAADYAFQPVSAEVKKGSGVTLGVRIVHTPTGKPVGDAVVFRTRLDMGLDGMGRMTTPVTATPSAEPGVYAFKADLPMAGRWALQLMVKIQGEPDTMRGTVVFTARN